MLQERLYSRLKSARSFTERLLQDFSDSDSWVHQIASDANHALWFVGHMGVTDNFMISVLNPDLDCLPDGYAELFGIGSQPIDDIASYPDVQQVCEFMRSRREVLLGILNNLSDEELAAATPEGAPEFMADFAAVFEMAIWHEGMHCGQLTTTRRSLGFAPLK
ncbi:MAG: DinB family protein [Planctomycetaceae bacterium]|nr:DinB family protein [Planctomycetaceae bacterium]